MTNHSTVLITGASTGIGAACADRSARRGHDLVQVARDKARLEALAARLCDECKIDGEVLRPDLMRAENVAAVEQRLRDDSRIGTLISNAETGQAGTFLDQSSESIDRLTHVNINAVTRLAAAIAPRPAAAGDSAIVNLGSVVGRAPELNMTDYRATQAYVLFLSQGLNFELAHKVRVRSSGVAGRHAHQDLGALRPGHQCLARSDGRGRVGRRGAGRLRPARTTHHPSPARGRTLGCA